MERLSQEFFLNGCHSPAQMSIMKDSMATMTDDEVAYQTPIVASLLLSVLKSEDVNKGLPAVGDCIQDARFCRAINDEDSSKIIDELCEVMTKSTDKMASVSCVWCIAVQNFDEALLTQKAELILTRLSEAFIQLSTLADANFEFLRIIVRLIKAASETMQARASLWWQIVLSSCFHRDERTRMLAKDVLVLGRSLLQANKDVMQQITVDLKSTTKSMVVLFDSDETYVLDLWVVIIEILGNILHHGTSLVNCLIAVVEKACLSPSSDTRTRFFKAWQSFIAVYATNLDVLCNVKRLQFLLQPFERMEMWTMYGVETKIVTWWSLIVSLEHHLQVHFTMLVQPLVQYCFGQCVTASTCDSPANKTRRVLSDDVRRLLVEFGTQILFLIFEENPDDQLHGAVFSCKLDRLPVPLLCSGAAFCNRIQWLLAALVTATFENAPSRRQLILHLWHRIALHLLHVASDADNRPAAMKLAGLFLQNIRHVTTRLADPVFTMELLESSISSALLPNSILLSSAVNLHSSDLLQETPCVFLLELLLQENVLKCVCSKKLAAIFVKLVSFEEETELVPVLEITNSIICRLAIAMDKMSDANGAFALWQHVANQLHGYIVRTKEINQGDDTEPDFTSVLATLVTPIENLLNRTLHLNCRLSLVRTWSKLYESFVESAMTVSSCNANTCCVEIVRWIFPAAQKLLMQTSNTVEDVLDLFGIITKHVQWDSAHIVSRFRSDRVTSHAKKEEKTGCSLTPLIDLLGHLFNTFMKGTRSDQSVAKKFIEQFGLVLENLHGTEFTEALVLLTPALSQMIRLSVQDNQIFNAMLVSRLEYLWGKLVVAIPVEHVGSYDSRLLEHLGPLFATTVRHRRKSFRVNSRQLWTETFAPVHDELVIPATLSAYIPFLTKRDPKNEDEGSNDSCGTMKETNDRNGFDEENIRDYSLEQTTTCIKEDADRDVTLAFESHIDKSPEIADHDVTLAFESHIDQSPEIADHSPLNDFDQTSLVISNDDEIAKSISHPDADEDVSAFAVATPTPKNEKPEDDDGTNLSKGTVVTVLSAELSDDPCGPVEDITHEPMAHETSVAVSQEEPMNTDDVLTLSQEDMVELYRQDVTRLIEELLENVERLTSAAPNCEPVSEEVPAEAIRLRSILKRRPVIDLSHLKPAFKKARCVTFASSPTERAISPEPQRDRLSAKDVKTRPPTRPKEKVDSEPICVELVQCADNVNMILHELSASTRTSGLSRVLASRKILTVGHLSALSEKEIKRLPIKCPKVKVAKNVLSRYLLLTRAGKPQSAGDQWATSTKKAETVHSTGVEAEDCTEDEAEDHTEAEPNDLPTSPPSTPQPQDSSITDVESGDGINQAETARQDDAGEVSNCGIESRQVCRIESLSTNVVKHVTRQRESESPMADVDWLVAESVRGLTSLGIGRFTPDEISDVCRQFVGGILAAWTAAWSSR